MRREVLSEPQREYDAQRDFVRAWGPSVEADLTVVLDSEMQRRNDYRRGREDEMVRLHEAVDAKVFEIAERQHEEERLSAWGIRVNKELEGLERVKEGLREKAARATGPSRVDGVSPAEVAGKAELFRAIDEINELCEHNDTLSADIRDLKHETDVHSLDTDTDSSDAAASPRSYHATIAHRDGERSAVDSESSSVPPTPPSSDAESEHEAARDVGKKGKKGKKKGGKKSGKKTDAAGSADADSPPERVSKLSQEKRGPHYQSVAYANQGGVIKKVHEGRNDMTDREAFELEREQFRFTMSKTDKLDALRENRLHNLRRGTWITIVPHGKGIAGSDDSDSLVRVRAQLSLEDAGTEDETWNLELGENSAFSLPLNRGDVQAILLGQGTEAFVEGLQRVGGYVAQSSPQSVPPSTRGLVEHPEELSHYAYRSVSIVFVGKTRVTEFCFVADNALDFESWLVGLGRATRAPGDEQEIVPRWSTRLNIAHNRDISRLAEAERQFCAINHVPPIDYLNAKYESLSGNRYAHRRPPPPFPPSTPTGSSQLYSTSGAPRPSTWSTPRSSSTFSKPLV